MRFRRSRGDRWSDPRLVSVALLAAALVPRPPGSPQSPPFGLDKGCHAVGHAVHVCSLLQTVDEDTVPVAVPLAVAASVGYAVLLERLQEHVPGRKFETGDVAASLVGSVIGVVLAHHLDRVE